MNKDVLLLTQALAFAARAHCNQRRKGPAQEPYINHLIEVMDILAAATGAEDTELLVAGLLHDTLEDCDVGEADLTAQFGERVNRMVRQNTDDMSLPKAERKARRIAAMLEKPADSRMVKLADVISNMRAVASSPPAGWTQDRKLAYLADCRALRAAARGTHTKLEEMFDHTAYTVEAVLSGKIDGEPAGLEEHHLDHRIGDQVHKVYLANTRIETFDTALVERFAKAIAETFPTVVVQEAHGFYDGVMRPILIARFRAGEPDEVVSLAQRLCLAFHQRFIGIEVGGRYIRVHSDDTG
ncbi:HD domain-containing protein [Roseibium aquae]|nr:HD domain-containing protein [Roseibium aquae]